VPAASPIDTILDKEEYTLEELLDEDELIQECKSLNARLTTFLKQKEIVEKLVRRGGSPCPGAAPPVPPARPSALPPAAHPATLRCLPAPPAQVAFLVDDPPADSDAKRQFKYPFAACEIFCCEVEGVFNTLLESDNLLAALFDLLHRPRPLNSMLAGYFARVVGSLLLRRSADVMQYLQRRQELLGLLVHHVDTTSVAEVLARLVGADDPRGYPTPQTLQWLAATDLPQQLADQLGPGAPAEAQANAAEVLAAVARSAASPLTSRLASPEFMERLVDRALAPHEGRAATHALNVCIALLEPPPSAEMHHGGGMMMPPDGAAAEVHERLRAEAIRCVSAACGRLVALLDGAAGAELRTSYGLIRPPVGQLRLKAVDLLAALLRTGDPGAEGAVMATRGVQRAMQLFLDYPFNNALHGGVAALVTSFEPGSEPLRDFLLRGAGLVDWLVAAPDEVTPELNPDNPREGGRPPMRAGYCGHVTQVANRLLHLADRSQPVRDFLAGHAGWQGFVRARLEPRNKLESVFAWQCGRPGAHGGGMDGEGGVMYAQGDMSMDFASLETGPFSRDVYQRYGVFADQDEEEEEEATATEWTMELPGARGPGKLSQPLTSFEPAFSDSDSDGEEAPAAPAPRDADADADAVVMSSPPGPAPGGPLGGDDLSDLGDDAVLYEAADEVAELQQEMEQRLTLGEGPGAAAEAAAEAAPTPPAEEAAPEFNANVYWKPTFAVDIPEDT
jgi:serine/threonine-protein phosphatase 6 regulatory subunit 3